MTSHKWGETRALIGYLHTGGAIELLLLVVTCQLVHFRRNSLLPRIIPYNLFTRKALKDLIYIFL